ncbi:hypothetical protein L484_012880 [Morus notabilis]|uniref:Uncharacterized protein n=1 Tax=Morus notabilis TaxID=981085 RepID=W9RNH7_9ROSA|nr:hypothetical protein L484_012880 [Morus notabilis]
MMDGMLKFYQDWYIQEKLSREFKPLKEDEPQEEEQEPFKFIFPQASAQMDSRSSDTDLPINEVSIQNHEFYKDQISCMAMDSEVESEEKLEGLFEDFLDEEEVREPLEDEEAYEAIELSSFVILSYTAITDPYFPPTLPSPYYVLYMIGPKEKFSFQAHHQSKRSCVRSMSRILPNHAKLESIHNLDPYIVLYASYCGRTPLFDEHFSKRPSEDIKVNKQVLGLL